MTVSDKPAGLGRAPLAAALALSALALGCRAASGPFVWSDAYRPPAPAAGGYVIAPGDALSVRVWNQEGMSGKARVRADGMISLPFVHDVKAAGLDPAALAQALQKKLKEYIVNPEVTVSLEEEATFEVSVLGEVAHGGVFKMERDPLLVKVLANAGGLNELARRDGIYVIRYADDPGKPPIRIRFTYASLTQAKGPAALFRLRAGDVVVVE